MTEEQKLIQKLRLVEALFAGTTSEGERTAAAGAMDRICERLKKAKESDTPIEYTFKLRNKWSRKFFTALLRRYGIKPYRYYRQRYTTVMAWVSASFVDQTLWPEFEQLDETLCLYLDKATSRVISE